jgi:hypothetical protein
VAATVFAASAAAFFGELVELSDAAAGSLMADVDTERAGDDSCEVEDGGEKSEGLLSDTTNALYRREASPSLGRRRPHTGFHSRTSDELAAK